LQNYFTMNLRQTIIFLLFYIITLNSFSQNKRIVYINPSVDTLNPHFHQVFAFWENYMDKLNIANIRSRGLLTKFDDELITYWNKSETDSFAFPDLYYSFMSTIGNAWYTNDIEYFLGIAQRDSNRYEIKTLFTTRQDSFFKGFPSLMITVPIIKTEGSYKLLNFLSLENHVTKRKLRNITYYFSDKHSFDDSLAIILDKRIDNFKQGFNISSNLQINYFVANNITEISKWFGIDYYFTDYISISNLIKGGYTTNNNLILSGGGGENCLHEVIHLLLAQFNHGQYMYFEEGVACFFGEHVGKEYYTHIRQFKKYLAHNMWINLSKSLYGYYESELGNTEYSSENNNDKRKLMRYRDIDAIYNVQYMVHAVICDMAYKKGGFNCVKELLLSKAENESDFYLNIEKVLSIKRSNLNEAIRSFINTNY